MTSAIRTIAAISAVAVFVTGVAAAQQPAPQPPAPEQAAPQQAAPQQAAPQRPAAPSAAAAPQKLPEGVTPSEDYVIGPDDALVVVFWRDKDMTTEVVVRPDGKITLPLINDIQAAGLTPEQLRVKIQAAASRYIEDPNTSVVVKQINSRKVFIAGQVGKPGPYSLSGPMTVLQLIAMAGGLTEFAEKKKIAIIRTENGKQASYQFDYEAVAKRTKLQQNILLKPGDTILVP